MPPTTKHLQNTVAEITQWLATYNGQPVVITSKYHYSPDRWWIVSAEGKRVSFPDGNYSGGSVYESDLKDIREEKVLTNTVAQTK